MHVQSQRTTGECKRGIRETQRRNKVGVGHKISKGKISDEFAIIFYIKKNKSNKELVAEGKEPIPENFYGIPTDVQEIEVKKRI